MIYNKPNQSVDSDFDPTKQLRAFEEIFAKIDKSFRDLMAIERNNMRIHYVGTLTVLTILMLRGR
jgi:hypothetical protein